MKRQMMSLERFSELCAAYGAKLELWPDAEREGARALLDTSEPARLVLRAETDFDGLWSQLKQPAIGPELARNLAEIPLRTGAHRGLPFRLFWPALGWAAAAIAGIIIGATPADELSSDISDVTSENETTQDNEVLELASGTFWDVTDNWEDVP